MRKPHQHSDLAWTELLRKYRNDTLSPDERTQLIALSKEDPFVADALEGTRVAANGDTLATNIAVLQAQLRQRTTKSRTLSYRPFWAAAALVFLLVASYLIYVSVDAPLLKSGHQETSSSILMPVEEGAPAVSIRPPVALLSPFGVKRTLPAVKPSLPETLALVEPSTLPNFPLKKVASAPVQNEVATDASRIITNETVPEDIVRSRVTSSSSAKTRTESSVSVAQSDVSANNVVGQVFAEGEDEPIPGVNVLIKGTKIGTVTDVDGRFTLPIDEENAILVFSAVGYATDERATDSADPIQVTLEPDIQSLSEVVVVGYGTQAKREVPLSTSAQPLVGMPSFRRYLRDSLRYPTNWSDSQSEVVKVNFLVRADGSLTDFTIKKGANQWLNQEAIRIIREGSHWDPATRNGRDTSQRVTVRVRFRKKR